MTVTLGVWHVLLLITFVLFGVSFIPVRGDTYGVGAFLRGIALLGAILLMWLVYFACRTFFG